MVGGVGYCVCVSWGWVGRGVGRDVDGWCWKCGGVGCEGVSVSWRCGGMGG